MGNNYWKKVLEIRCFYRDKKFIPWKELYAQTKRFPNLVRGVFHFPFFFVINKKNCI